MERYAVVLFDGDCVFCNKSVQFIIKHDPAAYFTFATLNGQTGMTLKEKYSISNALDSLVLIENDKSYDASTAALRISRKLTGIYKIGALFLVIPKPIRDAFYRVIAKRRHHFSGETACYMPSPEEKERFLD